MSKPIIAIDIDEVLFPMMDTFLDFHNANYGTALRAQEMKSYYVQDATGETKAEMLAKIKPYVSAEQYASAQPLAGSTAGIRRLSQKYSLVIVTSRDHFYRGSTEKFVQKHYPEMFQALRYTHMVETPDDTTPKYVICKELGATFLVDDSVQHVTECARNGVEGVLFGDYPWNQAEVLPNGVVRCKDWAAVLEYFDAR